jgi:polyisoprenoid-binding protein YceI
MGMNNLKFSGSLLIIFLLSTAFVLRRSAEREKITVDKKKSEVSYTMTHPLHEWTGISKEVNGVILYEASTNKIESVAVSILLSSFDSKNSNRDSHALEVLDAIKYPTVKLTSNNIQQNGEELTINGNLTFHNVTKPVVVQAKRSNKKNEMIVEGTFPVNITEYQIETPSLMGVKTKEVITLNFKIVFPM